MKIRKKFKIEMGHLVRNCSTEKCALTQHGHSAVIEVILKSDCPDNAGMVYDFSLLKTNVKALIDAFDHTYVFWEKDDPEFIEYIKKFNSRYIKASFNPSAENLALYFHHTIQQILDRTIKKNCESHIVVDSVIYHETETGYAQTESSDFSDDSGWFISNKYDCEFSEDIWKEFPEELRDGNMINPEPVQKCVVLDDPVQEPEELTCEEIPEELKEPNIDEIPERDLSVEHKEPCSCKKKTTLHEFLDKTDEIKKNQKESSELDLESTLKDFEKWLNKVLSEIE